MLLGETVPGGVGAIGSAPATVLSYFFMGRRKALTDAPTA